MDELIDKELEKEKGLPTVEGPALPFEKPVQFVHIPSEVIEIVVRYMPAVISTATPGRNVDVKTILENAKNMFRVRDGVRYHDALWMQHCAASLREILSFIEPGHFYQTYQSIRSTDPDVDKILRFLIRVNTYLSSVVHFRDSAKVGDAENLYPNQGHGQKNQGGFLNDEQSFFEKVCIDIVYTLHYLFTQYCTGGDNQQSDYESN